MRIVLGLVVTALALASLQLARDPRPSFAEDLPKSTVFRGTGFYVADPKTKADRLVALILVPQSERADPKVLSARSLVKRPLEAGRLETFRDVVKTMDRTDFVDGGKVRAHVFAARNPRGAYATIISDLFLGRRIFVLDPEAKEGVFGGGAGGAGGGGGGGGGAGAGGGGGH